MVCKKGLSVNQYRMTCLVYVFCCGSLFDLLRPEYFLGCGKSAVGMLNDLGFTTVQQEQQWHSHCGDFCCGLNM